MNTRMFLRACCLYGCLYGLTAITTVIPSTPDASDPCTPLMSDMAMVLSDARRNLALTPEQDATWRTWNASCSGAVWQQWLAALGPPVPPQPPPVVDPPRLPGWRDYVLGALEGFQRGLDTPLTACRTTYAQRGSRGGYSTICTTH
jgi:hypothetical protein